jgi:iron complex transport system substrate-binding protein
VRVVSLLPSTTEILFAIGAGDEVVGVTFECDHPREARSRTIVSSTTVPEGLTPAQIDEEVRTRVAAGEDLYRLDEGALRDLDADLIVTQDLCAVCAVDVNSVDAALRHLGCRAQVLTVDPMTLDDVLASIVLIGKAVGKETSAEALIAELHARLDRVAALVRDRTTPRIAVMEWCDPLYSAGHWVPDMVVASGAVPALGRSGERSRGVTADELRTSNADIVVVAPCGFGLADAAAQAETLVRGDQLPHGLPVWAVDANAAFVRPGPRVVDGIEALAAIAHPDSIGARPDLAVRVA